MGGFPHKFYEYLKRLVGNASDLTLQNGLGYRQVRQPKDWVCAEFPFLSFSHKLSTNVRKEYAMTIAFVLILLVRIILPLVLLLALGEWVHRREAHYWLRK